MFHAQIHFIEGEEEESLDLSFFGEKMCRRFQGHAHDLSYVARKKEGTGSHGLVCRWIYQLGTNVHRTCEAQGDA